MTIKKHGGIFGRNPTFNDVNIDGDLTVSGNLSANIEATTVTADSTVPLTVNRTGSQGDTIQIEDDGTKIGTVGVKGGALFLADVSGTGLRFESNGIVMTDGDGDKVAASYSLGLGAYPIGSIFLGSGHGIYMDGNNGTANKFDDYETGTWTSEIKVGNTGSPIGITAYEATYTKVGRLVFVEFRIGRNDASSLSGNVTWNLPFASGNATYFPSGSFWNDNTGVSGFVNVNSYANAICNGRTVGGSQLTFADYANGQSLVVSLVYQST